MSPNPPTAPARAGSRWKAYPAYRDSGIEWLGRMPDHWRLRRLKHLASSRFSNVDKHPIDGEIPVDLCNYVDVYYNDRITSAIDFMAATATREEVQKFSLRKDDVLVTKDSEEWDDIAVPAHVSEDLKGVLCGYHLAQIRPNADIIDGRYLSRSFATLPINHQFRVEATGITRYGLGKYSLDNAIFLVPPKDEQKAIVSFLDRETAKLDALIAKKERLIELLEEKRSALISHAVTKGLDPKAPMKDSGIEWLGKIPEHWDVKRLRRVGDAIIGLTYDPADVVGEGEGTLVLRASNVFNERIIFEDNVFVKTKIPERLITKVGDVLICSRSGSRALIGKSAKIDGGSAGLSFGTFMTVFRSECNDYLFHVFNSTLFDYQSATFLTSTVNQLTVGNLYSFEVPMPPRDEQSAIAEFLNHESTKIAQMVSKVETVVERLWEYRTALISVAVTGKIDVRGQ
ncbi:MAG: restriction endonuclease subunit S [Elusimicrobia bacterium]|nr:restriction endonuclease subunit S [Elusimicrobiota bacterium]